MSTCSIIIQGEGKGHFSQAMTLYKHMVANNVEVKKVYMGRSFFRKTPPYFFEEHHVKIQTFFSPNFVRTPDRKGIHLLLSILLNLLLSPIYLFEIFRLGITLALSRPDFIFNHYDPIGALACRFFGLKSKQAIISHHFYLSHPGFIHPHGYERSYFWLQWMNFLMRKTAHTVFALSFRSDKQDGNTTVVPPLIDPAIREAEPIPGERDLCYFLNEGYIAEILGYYHANPDIQADIFHKGSMNTSIPENVTLHPYSRKQFINCMLSCRRIITTAGFDTAAEGLFHGKPVIMIPSKQHYEQYCNALDAARTGLAYQLDHLGELDDLDFNPHSNKGYKKWAADQSWLDVLIHH